MTAETFEILSNSEVIAVNQGKETFYFMKKNKKKEKRNFLHIPRVTYSLSLHVYNKLRFQLQIHLEFKEGKFKNLEKMVASRSCSFLSSSSSINGLLYVDICLYFHSTSNNSLLLLIHSRY